MLPSLYYFSLIVSLFFRKSPFSFVKYAQKTLSHFPTRISPEFFFIHGKSWVFHIILFLRLLDILVSFDHPRILSTLSTFFSKKMFANLLFGMIRLFCLFFTKKSRFDRFSECFT